MPREYSCCVPSCQTRGRYMSFLNFPNNPSRRQKWIAAIPNLDCVVDHKSLICENHFEKGQVTVEGNKIVATNQALPSNFSASMASNSVKKYFPKYMFEIPERDVGPETFGDLEKLETEDFIVDFHYLKHAYGTKLGKLMINWHVSFAESYAFFYLLSLDHVGKIKCSVKINDKLLVQVAVSGRVMDPLDLTWILPVTSQITRWSQLKMLLFEFSVPNRHINHLIPDLMLMTPYLKYIN